MKTLKTSFPNANLPEDSQVQFTRDFETIAREVGCERFLMAIEYARKWEVNDLGNERPRKFFPNPNEVRSSVPPKPQLPEVAQWGCEFCNFTTWIQNEESRMIRCECFDVYRTQREAGCRAPFGTPSRSRAEWEAIRREQATPEFKKAWAALMKKVGIQATPETIARLMEGR